MTRQNSALIVNQHRIRKPEGLDAVRYLPDLLLGVGSGVLGSGPQRGYGEYLDLWMVL
ncbi:MAG: hypothetical protein ACSHXY_06095 [Alphaproteobacteria bacterium]